MVRTLIVLYFLTLACGVFGDSFCGPLACDLFCEEQEFCLEDQQLPCEVEPCCSRWSCIDGEGNGEEVCEEHNYGPSACESIGCCWIEEDYCWSDVGSSPCKEDIGEGGPLDGPQGPTVPGQNCDARVTFPKKPSPIAKYPLFTTVFGIPIIGSGISDEKFQHVASMLALWIDNDQDGCPDTPEVVTWLVQQKVVQWFGPGSDDGETRPDEEAIENAGFTLGEALLFDDEINPSCSGTLQTIDCSDACIEEIWHVVTGQGYAKAFPQIFHYSRHSNSNLTKAVDVARGGHFTSIPYPYPSEAWFSYYDETCSYECQIIEYIYWGVASWVGALENMEHVRDEWRFITRQEVMEGDIRMTALIQDTSKYRFPSVAPNGDYRGCNTCPTGVNHGGVSG